MDPGQHPEFGLLVHHEIAQHGRVGTRVPKQDPQPEGRGHGGRVAHHVIDEIVCGQGRFGRLRVGQRAWPAPDPSRRRDERPLRGPLDRPSVEVQPCQTGEKVTGLVGAGRHRVHRIAEIGIGPDRRAQHGLRRDLHDRGHAVHRRVRQRGGELYGARGVLGPIPAVRRRAGEHRAVPDRRIHGCMRCRRTQIRERVEETRGHSAGPAVRVGIIGEASGEHVAALGPTDHGVDIAGTARDEHGPRTVYRREVDLSAQRLDQLGRILRGGGQQGRRGTARRGQSAVLHHDPGGIGERQCTADRGRGQLAEPVSGHGVGPNPPRRQQFRQRHLEGEQRGHDERARVRAARGTAARRSEREAVLRCPAAWATRRDDRLGGLGQCGGEDAVPGGERAAHRDV